MIEALKGVGDFILNRSKDDFLNNLIETVEIKDRNGGASYVGIIDFDLENGSLSFVSEEMKEETPQKYLWIGNVESANSPQDRLTTNNVNYLLSQTIPNLVNCLRSGALKNDLLKIRDTFFYDLGEQKGAAKRYRFVLNISMLPGYRKDRPLAWKEEKVDNKSMVRIISHRFWGWVKETTGLSQREFRMFTIRIDGADIRKLEDYRAYLLQKKQEVFVKSRDSVCHICGRGGQVSSDTTKLDFSYYITDKIGFSSDLGGEKNFYKNLSFCKGCYYSLVASESFIKNFLTTRLANQNVYLMPEFIFPFEGDLPKWAKWVRASFEATLRGDHYKRFSETFGEGENQNNFLINILFWQKSQAEFKVLKLIQDVSPSRLAALSQAACDISDKGRRLFGGKNTRWELWLNNMYYLFPVRADNKKNPYEFKKVLDFYDAVFTGRKIEHSFLIQQFIRLAKICRYDQGEQFNIGRDGNGDQALVASILKANLLVMYLEKLGMLKEWGKMNDIILENFPEDLQIFIREMKYNAEQVALFGLGILIGEVGSAQFNARIKNKPILEKLNFQGMKLEKLIRVSNDIFAKLRQYKRLSSENEKIFAVIKKLLDRQIDTWSLSPQHNVFYILSGYAYRTNKIMSSAKNSAVKGEIFEYEQQTDNPQ